MLYLNNISATIARGTPLARQILNNIDLRLTPGEFVTLVGGNGAGKSTLFNVITGSLKADSGQVYLEQQDITAVSQLRRARDIAVVMQDPKVGTMEHLTVLENLVFAYKRGTMRGLTHFKDAVRTQWVQEQVALLGLGLETKMETVVANLSGGQRQALSLIMALLRHSKVLLLDEITAALDPNMAEVVMQLAYKLVRAEGRTCLAITHNMQHALTYGDRILLLKEGRIIKEFTTLTKQKLSPAMLAAELG